MRPIQVSIDIAAPPDTVWDCIKDIESHTRWMADAEAIRITSPTAHGVGTTFDCDTRVGPFRTVDRMRVVEWVDGKTLAIEHRGVVTGEGRFQLEPVETGTRFLWTERVRFPWYQGGRLAAVVARPVLQRVWRGNLERLRDLLEGGVDV